MKPKLVRGRAAPRVRVSEIAARARCTRYARESGVTVVQRMGSGLGPVFAVRDQDAKVLVRNAQTFTALALSLGLLSAEEAS